ncbi:signal peptidase II [Enterobacteriaceae endosymbiont of Donacia fulgens]|uniref:signal peptidase II n=1 Tax=Enterobacteriaceae endosymbiont of Donacia fulgens TaxID=2675778 RepID=UPI001449B1FB|nr:signal peptidase II [Enterobacteriaceae endosymbiont of Donacia fulgens]QJC38414.1 signal peptidase II [Enterobacteriaceae endosymbiont of Donacia fulgens]
MKITNIYILLFIVIDFFCKNLIIKKIKLYKCYHICSYLNFIYLKNYGIIFGFLKNYKNTVLVFNVINIIIIIFFFIKNKNKQLTNNFILGGILGNFISRIKYGFVIDFIDIHIYNYHFPVFNIADILICIGIIFIIKDIFLNI